MSIRERALQNGQLVYDVSVDLGPDDAGKRRQEKRSFRLKSEAKQWERQRFTEVREKRAHVRTRATVGEYMTSWLADVIRPHLEATTATQYTWTVEHRILPHLGGAKLADLNAARLQRWVADLSRTKATQGPRKGQPLSRRTIAEAHGVLHSALESAVRQRIIPFNPAASVQLPRTDTSIQKQTWTPEQAQTFLAMATQDVAYEPLWTLALHTGLRRGELLGIRWSDIDWDAGILSIRQTITKDGSTRTTKKPKNQSSRRAVPLHANTINELAAHRERQAAHKAECLDAYQDEDLVCCNWYGQPWYPDTVSHRFKLLVESLGIPYMNLHYTRHTFASLALGSGQSLAAVSEVLGHADRRTTQEIYWHVRPSEHVAVSGVVAGLLMSQNDEDVTFDVTKTSEGASSVEAPPEETGVHPWRLERQTFRSAILREPMPTPLATKHRPSRARNREDAAKRETDVG